MNTATVAIPLTEDQRYCALLLREALDMADDGKVNAVAMVVCTDSGWATVMGGKRAGDLHLGCADLQAKILDAVRTGNVARPPVSKILRTR